MDGLLHLARRFLGALRTRSLTPAQQVQAAELLRPEEHTLFWRQAATDQAHAVDCARRVLRQAPSRRDLARAALLHDVGKGTARLGVGGRVLATGLSLLHLPARGRLREYLMHGSIGAEALAAAGAEPVVVAYARFHHGERPPEIPPADWQLLTAADRS